LIQLTYSRAEIRATALKLLPNPKSEVPPAQMSLPEQFFLSHSRNGLFLPQQCWQWQLGASGSDRAF